MFTEMSELKFIDIYGRKLNCEEDEEANYVSFLDAKKLNSYKYNEDMKLCNIKDELKKIEDGKHSGKLGAFDSPIKLSLCNLAIELTLLPNIKEDENPPEVRYVIWKRNPNSKMWKVLEIILDDVNLDIDDNLIEEFMFNKLIEFAMNNYLYWNIEQ